MKRLIFCGKICQVILQRLVERGWQPNFNSSKLHTSGTHFEQFTDVNLSKLIEFRHSFLFISILLLYVQLLT